MKIPRFTESFELPRRSFIGLAAALLSPLNQSIQAQNTSQPEPAPLDGKLRIIVFGAHPDDCEFSAGGTAAKWAAQGHHVKFVSCTNGDIGHWRMAGGPLAQRRRNEVQKCAEILGTSCQVLDIHDGELMVTLENRKLICRLIREWQPDIVISHRPNDYHPDHRYVGVLVMDAAFMVTVPHFCPSVPALARNPVFLFTDDEFTRPNRFTPDVVISIDDTIEKKLGAIEALESQFYEGGCSGGPHLIPDPKNAAAVAARKQQVREEYLNYTYYSPRETADRFRAALIKYYGEEAGSRVRYAEAFEVCEYGRKLEKGEVGKLFPFFGA